MREEKRFSVLRQYLRQYRWFILLLALFVGIFAVVFSLYRLEVEAVWYAAGLCALVGAGALTAHFVSYRARHRERQALLKNIAQAADQLPPPATLEEADGQALLLALKRELDAERNAWRRERRESMDYYTAWVHQIKTPISVMRMLLNEDTEEHRALSVELFRIEQYVEMVLSYLRLGGESSDFVIRECPLDPVIRAVLRKYAPQFVQRRIRLSYTPTSMTVLTDEKWLRFILEQLLSNAVKYTFTGSVSITVTPEKVVQIADTGIGIAPEDLPRIFEKGFTGYNGRMDQRATGLGLYLSRVAAEKLSHKLSATSEVGVGTVLSLDLHTDPLTVE